MCGIWGFITAEKDRGATGRLRYTLQSATVGTLRGSDSTGVILVAHDSDRESADWVKSVGTGEAFLRKKMVQEKLTYDAFKNMRGVLGHNRAATTGDVTTANAHPFQEGPITLIHNGTLDYTYALPIPMHKVKEQKRKEAIEVDSHLICHNLAHHDWKEVLESLRGAYALVWHDARTDAIHMARNHQRPLHLMRAKCEDTVLFASEADMLWWVAGRTNFTRDTIYSLDTGVLLTFEPGSTKPKAERYDLYKATSYYRGGGSTSSYSKSGGTTTPGKAQAASTPSECSAAGATKKSKKFLEEIGFDARTPLDFSVDQIVPLPNERVIVNGWAYFLDDGSSTDAIQAIVYGLDSRFAYGGKDEDWLVRPVGVTMAGDKGKEEPVLICRLVRIMKDLPQGGVTDMLIGPGGAWLTRREWLDATDQGCVQCGAILSVTDHEKILWTSASKEPKPMCPQCVAEWKEDRQMLGRMI